MIVGEGTNEIQRNVIAAQLISRGALDRWACLASRPGSRSRDLDGASACALFGRV